MKVIDYLIIFDHDAVRFFERVRDFIKQGGWQPWGPVSVTHIVESLMQYTQIMVRYYEPEPISDYRIIDAASATRLARKVRSWINRDWQPIGPVFTTTTPISHETTYHQTIVQS